jgi:hypothetical protein
MNSPSITGTRAKSQKMQDINNVPAIVKRLALIKSISDFPCFILIKNKGESPPYARIGGRQPEATPGYKSHRQ